MCLVVNRKRVVVEVGVKAFAFEKVEPVREVREEFCRVIVEVVL